MSQIIKPFGRMVAKIEIVIDEHGTVNMQGSHGLHPLKVAEVLCKLATGTLETFLGAFNNTPGVQIDASENPPDNGNGNPN